MCRLRRTGMCARKRGRADWDDEARVEGAVSSLTRDLTPLADILNSVDAQGFFCLGIDRNVMQG